MSFPDNKEYGNLGKVETDPAVSGLIRCFNCACTSNPLYKRLA